MTAVTRALAALDRRELVADLQRLVQTPSLTGQERAVMEVAATQARAAGLSSVALREYDLGALRAHPDHPGEEAPRTELWNVGARLPGATPDAPVLALCAHLDVVGPGTAAWLHGSPWSGAIDGGRLYGRGSADMKAAFAAALHAVRAVRTAALTPRCAVQLLGVSSEEDGGLGAFAALQEDANYAACIVPEPTSFDARGIPTVMCGTGGIRVAHGLDEHVSLDEVEALARVLIDVIAGFPAP